MRKFSLLIALALLITVSGVYAAWVYSQSNDVADISAPRSITMTEATFEGSYGTYTVDTSGLTMTIDPKDGTTHVTALYITGSVRISFVPSAYAPVEVKNGGVPSQWFIAKDSASWTYESQSVITVDDTKTNVVWTPSNGGFVCEITADQIKNVVHLAEITLDDKVAYDAYAAVLGALDFHVTDGKSASTIVTD